MSDVARLLGWQLHAQWLYHRISFVWRSQYTICSTNLVFRTFQKFWQLIRNCLWATIFLIDICVQGENKLSHERGSKTEIFVIFVFFLCILLMHRSHHLMILFPHVHTVWVVILQVLIAWACALSANSNVVSISTLLSLLVWALVTRCFLCFVSLNAQYSPLISEHLLRAVTLLLNGNVTRCIVLVVFYFLSFGARWSGRNIFRSTCRGIHLLSWITQVFQTCITL